MKKIWVVNRTVGEYEDTFTCADKAFTSREEADKYCKEQNDYYRGIEDRYHALDDMLLENLRDEVVLECLRREGKAEVAEHYKNCIDVTDEDSEIFFDTIDRLEQNESLLYEIASQMMSEKDRDDLLFKNRYDIDYGYDGIPYFSVSYNPIELIEE